MKLLNSDNLSSSLFLPWQKAGNIIYENWTTYIKNENNLEWLRSIPNKNRVIQPKYAEIHWNIDTDKYCIWYIHPEKQLQPFPMSPEFSEFSGIDIINVQSWMVVKSIDLKCDKKCTTLSALLSWNYLVTSMEVANTDELWYRWANYSWIRTSKPLHKVSVLNVQTGWGIVIDDPNRLIDGIKMYDWKRIFAEPKNWPEAVDYFYDISLQKHKVPTWYEFSKHWEWLYASEWIIKLKNYSWQDEFIRELGSSNHPIWPYDRVWTFSEGKCLVMKNWIGQVIDKIWTVLFELPKEKSIDIHQLRASKLRPHSWFRRIINNVFHNWLMVYNGTAYNQHWEKVFSLEWTTSEKENLIIYSYVDWVILWLRTRDSDALSSYCLFNDRWKLLLAWDMLWWRKISPRKVKWYLIKYIQDNSSCSIYEDKDYLSEVTLKRGKMTEVIIENSWEISSYLIKNETLANTLITTNNIKDIVQKAKKIEVSSSEDIEVWWKKFKRKYINL
jgi:hypothetical protein